MKGLIEFVLNRLKEPSTWRGIILVLTVSGVALDPDQKEAIITAGVSIVALVGVFSPDRPINPLKKPMPTIDPNDVVPPTEPKVGWTPNPNV